MEIGKEGLNLIKKFERFKAKPYLCPAGIPTIGYGNTFYLSGKKVALTDKPITEEEAEFMLQSLVDSTFSNQVESQLKVSLTQLQFDALVSFEYNLGLGNLRTSTLLKKVNDKDFKGAALEFPKWNKAGGKVLPGLTARRLAEKELFEKGTVI